ncbi:MAG: hypothetical protein ACI865_001828 [Flavobacteriaceae bacterium]|jgi:hypothetical protein
MMSEKSEEKRLLKNVLALIIVGGFGYLAYWYFTRTDDTKLLIANTPMQIKSIRTIAEISTIHYRDELVVDSVERYGNVSIMEHPIDWYQSQSNGGVKRQLTIIVDGEVNYGLDLSNGNYSIDQTSNDSLFIHLPKAKLLDVIITPSQTEIFQETGKWSDSERKTLEAIAKKRLLANASGEGLDTKAEEQARSLFKQMIQTDKTLIVTFGDKH